MVEFAYNNTKNTSISYTPFELNCSFHLRVFYKKNVNFCSQSKTSNQLATELQNLISIYKTNLEYTQNFQQRYHDKYAQPRSYVSRDKVWLNSKYIKIKQNCKLNFQFFGLFLVLHPVEKQVYKLKVFKRCKIHDIFFHMSLLK